MGRKGWIAVCLVTAAIGCGGTESDEPPDQYKEQFHDVPVGPAPSLDILFVVDTSSSMADEAANLVENVPRWIASVEDRHGCRPSLHIGVVSSDLGTGSQDVPGCTADGDGAAFQTAARAPGCTPPGGPYLVDEVVGYNQRETNYTGTMTDAVSCVAALGSDGCEFQQPLEAMRRALDGSVPGNDGFRREDAALIVVFATDGDDCSVSDDAMFDPGATALGPLSPFRCFEYGVECTPDDPRTLGLKNDCAPRADSPYVRSIDEYEDFLLDLRVGFGLMVAVIGGDAPPVTVGDLGSGDPELLASCSSSAGTATPSVRLNAFADRFDHTVGMRSSVTSICQTDLRSALEDMFGTVDNIEGTMCLAGSLIDIDASAPGVQPWCSVTEVLGADATGPELVLPACDNPDAPASSANQPCYHIAEDNAFCDTTQTSLSLTRYPSRCYSDEGSHLYIRCAVE